MTKFGWLWSAVGLLGGTVVYFSQTDPDEAVQHLTKWQQVLPQWASALLPAVPDSVLKVVVVAGWIGALLALLAGARALSARFMETLRTAVRTTLGEPAVQNPFPGTSVSLDEFDIVADRLVVRAQKSGDDGTDVTGMVWFRNRSPKPVTLDLVHLEFEFDGKRPEGSSGYNRVISKAHTDGIRFHPIRVYKDENFQGSARLCFKFGQSMDTMRSIIDVHYTFKVIGGWPANKSVDAALELEVTRQVTYYVNDAGPFKAKPD